MGSDSHFALKTILPQENQISRSQSVKSKSLSMTWAEVAKLNHDAHLLTGLTPSSRAS